MGEPMHEASSHLTRRLRVVSLAIAAVATGIPAQSPIPDRFTNLEVLPKEISRRELVDTMKGFTFALGVECQHCHAPKPGADPESGRLEDLDFPSDAREAKRTARVMLRMVRAINADHLAELPEVDRLAVTCATCHRGVTRPEPIEAIVERTLAEGGAEDATAAYRDLRAEHYGSAAYDFSEWPLDTLGERLLERGTPGDAAAVLRLNGEFHPDSGWLAYLLGEAELAAGDREAARAAFVRALEIEPRNTRAKKRLEELTGDASP